jgi:hypothetical protein
LSDTAAYGHANLAARRSSNMAYLPCNKRTMLPLYTASRQCIHPSLMCPSRPWFRSALWSLPPLTRTDPRGLCVCQLLMGLNRRAHSGGELATATAFPALRATMWKPLQCSWACQHHHRAPFAHSGPQGEHEACGKTTYQHVNTVPTVVFSRPPSCIVPRSPTLDIVSCIQQAPEVCGVWRVCRERRRCNCTSLVTS